MPKTGRIHHSAIRQMFTSCGISMFRGVVHSTPNPEQVTCPNCITVLTEEADALEQYYPPKEEQ